MCQRLTVCPADTIRFFDSMGALTISNSVKEQLAALIRPFSPYLTVQFMETQRQVNGADCGLFAIANAFSLCSGKNLFGTIFNQQRMRRHLLSCFKARLLTPFPGKSRGIQEYKVLREEKVAVFCSCQLPDSKWEKKAMCSLCHEWFHASCQTIPQAVFKNKLHKFTCSHCQ